MESRSSRAAAAAPTHDWTRSQNPSSPSDGTDWHRLAPMGIPPPLPSPPLPSLLSPGALCNGQLAA